MKIIDLTPENIGSYGVCGYKDAAKHLELRNKLAWFNRYYPLGLRIKAVLGDDGSYQGMLEYIPGQYAHRPVEAAGYMFIHCLFVGFNKEHKGRGYATHLVEECIQEAKAADMQGVAIVTRDGPFMAGDEIFTRLGFRLADEAKPDFHLLVKKFDAAAENPRFKADMLRELELYQTGLTVLRSPQCPYTEKNVQAIIETARQQYGLDVRLIDLLDAESAQRSPCPFGSFCLIYNGKVISHHPISNTRFVNIMDKILAKN